LLRNVSGAAKNSLQSIVQPNFAARHVKRKLELIKRYDSHINVVIDDGKLRYIKQCDHCGMEFRACRQTVGSAAQNVMINLEYEN
jgi:predicted transcriptional regulator